MDNPYAAPQVAVPATEERPSFDLASRWSRLFAALADGIIIGVVFWVTASTVFGYSMKQAQHAGFAEQLMLTVLAVGLFVLLNGILLHARGQTLGKWLLGIRIVDLDGRKPAFWPLILKRYAAFWVIQKVPVLGGLANLVNVLFIFRSDRRCLHDLLANTAVVTAR